MNPSDDTTKPTDDVVYEDTPDLEAGDDLASDATQALAKIKELRTKLAACEKEKMEYLSGWQRAKADMVNANRRHDEERLRFSTLAENNLILEILPALDGFDMAMANKAAWESIDPAWRTGVEYIRTQLASALTRSGVEVVRPLGLPFDPAHHDSVGTSAGKEGIVAEVLQAGYVRGSQVIRPAIVKTGDGTL